MTFSCTDFTDAILDALGIVVPEEDCDDPSAQADLALAEIARLQRKAKAVKRIAVFAQRQCDRNTEEAALWAQIVSIAKKGNS